MCCCSSLTRRLYLSAGSGPGAAKELKKGSVMDILGKPPGPLSPATQLKQGSVMDILGKGRYKILTKRTP